MPEHQVRGSWYSVASSISSITCLLFLIGNAIARLEIVNPYHPLYIKSGESLIVTCESRHEPTTIEWVEQTVLTNWTDSPLFPARGSRVTVQTFSEMPSGLTRSTLIKRNMTLGDRGVYVCKDALSNYAIWVTVLRISARNLSSLTGTTGPLVLGCTVTGFDSNPPAIDYDWAHNGAYIPHPHHQAAAAVMHSPDRLVPIDKYSVSMRGEELRLEIHDHTTVDAGLYTCSFTFKTNIGYLTLTDSIYLNETQLNARTAGAEKSSKVQLSILTFIVILLAPLLVEL